MFKILWFAVIALSSAAAVAWILDNDGTVLLQWLGYQVDTDISMALLILVMAVLVIFSISYLLARILAFKFPNLFKIFARKRHIKNLECKIDRQNRVLELMPDLILALEGDDFRVLKKVKKKILKISDNQTFNNFVLEKLKEE